LQEQLDLPASSSGGWDSYATLQRVRGAAYQAIGALATYDSAASPALRGEMYALQGYAEIMLADLFCSGVPLSTLDFQGDFTYHPGLTTQEVYADAVAKFDTALTLSTDSVNIQNLARVGKARALLDMDSASAAAQAVADVPDGFQFQIRIPWRTVTNNSFAVATVSDREGGNGLPFISSDDPRTTAASTVTTNMNLQLYFPQKYVLGVDGYSPTTVADWIEARLIRAEAALAAGDPTTWLSQLNYLRQHATVAGQTQAPLDSLTDPGSDSARVSLMFQERASWMYMTGHRQGDLRREIRQYGREQSQIYPVGEYLAPGIGVYGTDVNAPIPSSENPNPFFHGCRDRNA
jgi:hypothetical protein